MTKSPKSMFVSLELTSNGQYKVTNASSIVEVNQFISRNSRIPSRKAARILNRSGLVIK